MVKIEGYVENIVFKSKESDFSVIEIEYQNKLLTVTGNFINIQEGEKITLYGEFTSHPKYGAQFKAKAFETTLPSSAAAIKKYLSSGIVKGIGPVIAERILNELGENCLEIIQNNPFVISGIKGISANKIPKMIEEFNKIFGIKSLMNFLSKYKINSSKSISIWNLFGNQAINIIKENPYILCRSDIGINFEISDKIALDLNFNDDNYDRISSGIDFVLSKNATNGHTCVPKKELIEMSSRLLKTDQFDNIEEIINKKINCLELFEINKNREYIFLKEFYYAERYICERLIEINSRNDDQDYNVDMLIDIIQKENNIVYDEIQKEVIQAAINNNLMILTGRPGTGKTTTLNAIISILEQKGDKIILTAPTGRAAKILSKVTGKEAKTIHRLLEVSFENNLKPVFVKNERNKIDCDTIIIDEMSMIDTLLFESLLKATSHTTKIIMVGDCDQLPSIGAGNILHDLINSKEIKTIRLTKIFRQAQKSLIIKNAHSIVNGQMPELDSKDNDFFFIKCNNQEKCANIISSIYCERLPKSYKLSPLEDIQIICPSKKGYTGTIHLNKLVQSILNPNSDPSQECQYGNYTFRKNDKVIQIKNNYNIEWDNNNEKGIGIFNGDIGIIKDIDKVNGIITIDFENRVTQYPIENISEIELAYAITVHKSQGSEFNAVIVPIIEGFNKLYYRNLLYTAVTRSKKILIITGQKERIKYMVNNNQKMLRYTGISYFLKKGLG